MALDVLRELLRRMGKPGLDTSPAQRVPAGTRFALAVLLAAAMSSGSDLYAAGRVFFDGFEGGHTNQWSQNDYRNKCSAVRTSVDGKPTSSGSYMLECNWNGGVAWNAPASYSTLVLNSWSYSREYLMRFRVRYASDVDRVGGNKLLRLAPSDPGNAFFLDAQMEQSGGPMFLHWFYVNGQSGPIFWGDGTPLGDGNWHEIEIYVKHNSPGQSDGALKVWQDGNIKQQAVNIVSAAPNSRWFPVHIMSNWSSNPGWEHDANNHAYWDDFELYSDTGTGASGSMADGTISSTVQTTAPAAPTNLRVVS